MTSPPTTGRRRYTPRLPLPERREQLLDAALTVIDEGGYRGVSIDAIARRAEVSRPVVYDAFGGLTELLMALLEREEQRAFAVIGTVLPLPPPSGADPAELFARTLGGFARAVAADPRPWRLMLLTPEGTPDEVRRHVEAGRETITGWLEQLVQWGAERAGMQNTDSELVAHAMLGLGEQVARLSIADPERFSAERIERLGKLFAQRLLAGPGAGVRFAGDEADGSTGGEAT